MEERMALNESNYKTSFNCAVGGQCVILHCSPLSLTSSLLNNRAGIAAVKRRPKKPEGQQKDRASVSPPFPAAFFPAPSKGDAQSAPLRSSREAKEKYGE